MPLTPPSMPSQHATLPAVIPTKKTWAQTFATYLDKRALIMLFLGFSAGIPILLIFSSLGLWLREAGIERGTVTMFSWAALGYSFKFIWAPLVDALPVPILTKWLGRRRAWLLVAQGLIITAILTMASIDPSDNSLLKMMAFGAVLLGFSSATQDIVIDAYRIELAPAQMQSVLSATYSAGYRIGMIVAGAGALFLADYFGSTEKVYSYTAWRDTYWIMACVMGVGLVVTLTSYEPLALLHDPEKQRKKEKVMGWFAAMTLIPLIFMGIIYLINLLLNKFFGVGSLILDVYLSVGLLGFLALGFMVMPFAIIYLLFQQPRISNSLREKSTNNNDYVRILVLFLLSVTALVFTYMVLSPLLPTKMGIFLGFLLEAVHLLTSLSVAIAVGYGLVLLKLVKKQVAYVTWVEPIVDFFRRYGRQAILLLLLIGLYRISDIVAGVISNVFYEDMGFSKTDIATAVKTFGVLMVIAGGFLGGILTQKMRIMRAMMVGGVLASTSHLMFTLLALQGHDIMLMYLAVAVDNLAAGLQGAVFIAFLSALTNIRFTAVQYALFSSLMTLFPKVLGGYSGTIVDNIGYPWFFVFTTVIGFPVLYLVYLVDKHMDITAENSAETAETTSE